MDTNKDSKWPKIAIIVLNWNKWQDTIECLESVYQITYPNYEVILVDNGSEDESIQKIKEYCEGKIKVTSGFFNYEPKNKPIKIIEYTKSEAESGNGGKFEDLPKDRKMILIKNDKNYGFAEGNNIAMNYALSALKPDYILLLNNDTVVDREFLSELTSTGESYESAGIIGPKIYYYDDPKRIWVTVPYGNMGKIDCGEFKGIIEVKWVVGCAFFLRTSTINEIGLFDPDFFLYGEESDYCMRVHKAGYKMYITNSSLIWHKEPLEGKIKPYQVYYENRNTILLWYKNYPRIKFYIYLIVFNIRPFRLLRLLRDGRSNLISPMLLGLKDGVLWCFGIKKAGRSNYIKLK